MALGFSNRPADGIRVDGYFLAYCLQREVQYEKTQRRARMYRTQNPGAPCRLQPQ